MRKYELTFIIAPDVDEQEFNAVLAQVQQWVEASPGKVSNVHQWGRRKMAYSISTYTEGYYVTYNFEVSPQATAELERQLRLNERVIRHLLIRADEID